MFVLEPTDYIIGPAEGNPDLCLSWPKAAPPSADGVDWLLGTIVYGILPCRLIVLTASLVQELRFCEQSTQYGGMFNFLESFQAVFISFSM
jgi:hypothetical protein